MQFEQLSIGQRWRIEPYVPEVAMEEVCENAVVSVAADRDIHGACFDTFGGKAFVVELGRRASDCNEGTVVKPLENDRGELFSVV